MKTVMRRLPLLVVAAAALGACDTVRDLTGLDRTGPDEYAVSPAAPLAIPPDFTLRPPTPGAPRPQEVRAEDKAKQALLGTVSANTLESDIVAPASGAESAILDQTKNYASRIPDEKIKQGAIPQPEVMRALGGETAPSVDGLAEAVADPESERLHRILNAPTTDGGAISVQPESKPFWDSWF